MVGEISINSEDMGISTKENNMANTPDTGLPKTDGTAALQPDPEIKDKNSSEKTPATSISERAQERWGMKEPPEVIASNQNQPAAKEGDNQQLRKVPGSVLDQPLAGLDIDDLIPNVSNSDEQAIDVQADSEGNQDNQLAKLRNQIRLALESGDHNLNPEVLEWYQQQLDSNEPGILNGLLEIVQDLNDEGNANLAQDEREIILKYSEILFNSLSAAEQQQTTLQDLQDRLLLSLNTSGQETSNETSEKARKTSMAKSVFGYFASQYPEAIISSIGEGDLIQFIINALAQK
jgi:hypothetical protein